MYPYVEQLLRWSASDQKRRLGGLILEVKGDFCGQVQSILRRRQRETDYVEIGFDNGVCYNPWTTSSILRGRLRGDHTAEQPVREIEGAIWQQAYIDLLKFVILLRRTIDGYTTFSDVYRYILDNSQIDRDIQRLKAALNDPPDVLVIKTTEYREHCIQKPWTHWFQEDDEQMAHPYEAALERFLASRKVVYEVRKPKGAGWAVRKHQLEAVERWYVHGWSRLDGRLRPSIVEGVVVFLSLFDDNPSVHRALRLPRSAYVEEPKAGESKPLAPVESLLESGRVLPLNFRSA